MNFDRKYIDISKFLLKKILGSTFPNPPVFSLLVESDKDYKNSKIINFGYTNSGGRPHAEAEAIKKFKYNRNKKYTLYSTLEPCCHKGRDEDCVSKILRTKINRVVYSIKDPDKRVDGKGIEILKKHGLDVKGEVDAKEIKEIYSGYISNRKLNKPRVTLKVGCSLDSKIAYKPKQRDSITNNMAKKILHLYRSEYDGILVGANTVKIDNPKLNCRIEGLKKTSPHRIILSKNLDFSENSEVLKNCKTNPTILVTTKSNTKKINKLFKKNVKILFIDKTRYNLKNILNELSNYGICNLLVEGGRSIFSSFMNDSLVDQIMIFRSNFFVGTEGLDLMDCENKNFKDIFYYKKIFLIGNNSLEILEKKN